ncbi:MAG: hypothetical protein H6818_21070 [Phycisphaerales bacterium]|nr:hypothetical protein [Phycisphaerales bacterium]MCB9862284.1 hypothetical protein [Phycisphaerales bacterium]
MASPHSVLVAITLVVMPLSASRAGDLVDFSFWELGSSVDVDGQRERDISSIPQNPYQYSQSAMIGQTTASMTTYDVTWNHQQLDFLMDAVHALSDTPTSQMAFSRSTGTLRFTPVNALRVSFDLEYDYDALGSRFQAHSSFSVGTEGIGLVFIESLTNGPLDLGPPVGAFYIQGQVEVPAGLETAISYQMMIRTLGGGSNAIGVGDGSLHITFESIPEPEVATLLGLAAVPILLRRRVS